MAGLYPTVKSVHKNIETGKYDVIFDGGESKAFSGNEIVFIYSQNSGNQAIPIEQVAPGDKMLF